MAEMRIRIGADDIERIILGADPSEEVRLEFRQAVLTAYANAHIKPIENSEVIRKFRESMSAELNVALEKYVTSQRAAFGRYELKPELKKTINAAASEVFETQLNAVMQEQGAKLNAVADDMRKRVASLEQRVESTLAAMGGHKDGETFVYDSFTKSLNSHLDKFLKGRTLGEMEELAELRLKKAKRK